MNSAESHLTRKPPHLTSNARSPAVLATAAAVVAFFCPELGCSILYQPAVVVVLLLGSWLGSELLASDLRGQTDNKSWIEFAGIL